jgi:hypothetical protein
MPSGRNVVTNNPKVVINVVLSARIMERLTGSRKGVMIPFHGRDSEIEPLLRLLEEYL